jgi:hypothetical protein
MKTQEVRKASTLTVSINADYNEAFNYIADPMNQKEWAINFVKDVKETSTGHVATTIMGESSFEVFSNKELGTIDLLFGQGDKIPTRLVKNNGSVEYIFTLFKPDEMPEFVWENEGVAGLREELDTLKTILEK